MIGCGMRYEGAFSRNYGLKITPFSSPNPCEAESFSPPDLLFPPRYPLLDFSVTRLATRSINAERVEPGQRRREAGGLRGVGQQERSIGCQGAAVG